MSHHLNYAASEWHAVGPSKHQSIVWLGLTAFSIILYASRPDTTSWQEAALGLAIIWLSCLPLLLFLRGHGSGPLPLMPGVGLFYGLAFGLPVFLDFSLFEPGMSWVSEKNVAALVIVIAGLVSLYFSYYIFRDVVWIHTTPCSLGIANENAGLPPILWALIVCHLADRYVFHLSYSIASVKYLLDTGALVGYGCLTVQLFQGQLSAWQRWLLVGVVLPLELIARTASGSLAEPMQLGLLLLFVYWLVRRRLPWRTILVCSVVLLELHNVKHKYRQMAWFDGELTDASPLVKLQQFAQLALEQSPVPDDPQTHTGLLTNSFTLRAAQLGFLTHVVELTPGIVPYLNGETYKIIVYKVIPRLLWPDKPAETMGQDFSRRYDMRDINDETTSFNVPWMVEMYANFGTVGVTIGMGLVGVLFAFLDRKFNCPAMLMLDRVLGMVLVFDLIYQESNFSLMIGNKLSLYLSLRLVFVLILKRDIEGKRFTEIRTAGQLRTQVH